MQIEPATCPACGSSFDPLRARAVMVVDGRVRAFCSIACRDDGLRPAEHARSEAVTPASVPRASLWRNVGPEYKLFASALVAGIALVGVLVAASRHRAAAPPIVAASPLPSASAAAQPPSPVTNDSGSDLWIHPLAGTKHPIDARRSRRFGPAREGIPPEECKAGQCSIDVPANNGDVVMAVHDGVIEEIVRTPTPLDQGSEKGRFIRINHNGGTVVSSYLQLDGIREDLKPGIPVKLGDPIGSVGPGRGKQSAPHLRFAISIRSADGNELYIDPEPMLVLWPMRERATASLHAMQVPVSGPPW